MFRGRLFRAVVAGDEEEVKKLIEAGDDVNENGYRGAPLHEASRRGRTEMVQLLCASSADVNARDITQETPLHCAVSCGQLEVAKILLNHGAEVNSQEFAGSTPLHSATTSLFIPSIQVRQQLIEVLMAAGGDPSIRDKVGIGPMENLHVQRVKKTMADRDADNKRDLEMRRFLELTERKKGFYDESSSRVDGTDASTDTKDDNPENDVGKEANPNSQQVGVPPNKHGADASFDATQHKISLWIEGANKLFARSTNERSKEMSVRDGNDSECNAMLSYLKRENSPERAPCEGNRPPGVWHGFGEQFWGSGNSGVKQRKQISEMLSSLAPLFPSPSKNENLIEQDPITVWRDVIIPDWGAKCNDENVHKIWRQGISPYVRGKVWQNAIGNDLKLSEKDYHEMLHIVNEFLKSDNQQKSCSREESKMRGFEFVEHAMFDNHSSTEQSEHAKSSYDVFLEPPWIDHPTIRQIELDLDRTYTELGLFATDGVYHNHLRNVLRAYSCFRPSIGYVQGMGYIASIFLVYMEPCDVFVCMANLLHRYHFPAFLKVDIHGIDRFVAAFDETFNHHLPNLHRHLKHLGVDSRLFLVEWWMTGFCTVLPIDAASVVWDLLLLEGIASFVRITIGVLHELEEDLVQAPLEVCLTCLTHMEDFFETSPPSAEAGSSQELVAAQLRKRKSFKSVLDYANSLDISSDNFMRSVEKDRKVSLSSSSKDVRQFLRQIAMLAKEDEKAARERRNHLHDAILARWTHVWRAAKSWSDEMAGEEHGKGGEAGVRDAGAAQGEEGSSPTKDVPCPGKPAGEKEEEREETLEGDGSMRTPQGVSTPLNAVVEAAEKLSREFQNAAEVFRGRHILPLASGATGMKIPWQLGKGGNEDGERVEGGEGRSSEEGQEGSQDAQHSHAAPPLSQSIPRKLEAGDGGKAKGRARAEREVRPLVPPPAFFPRAVKTADVRTGDVK